MHTRTSLPRSISAACDTFQGFTQTEAKPNCSASPQILRISSRVASGFSSVWSIRRAISASIGPTAGAGGYPRSARFDDFARLSRAFFGASLVAARADELVNFEAAQVGAFFVAEIAEDFFGDGLDDFVQLLLVHPALQWCNFAAALPDLAARLQGFRCRFSIAESCQRAFGGGRRRTAFQAKPPESRAPLPVRNQARAERKYIRVVVFTAVARGGPIIT